MNRKHFFTMASVGAGTIVSGGLGGCINKKLSTSVSTANLKANKPVYVPSGKNRFLEEMLIWGVIPYQVKVSGKDTNGAFFSFEHADMPKGGPPRHFHYEQDEWFYAVEGEFAFEVGDQKFTLNPGDSLFAPRMIPHVWAYKGEKPGKILLAVQPAGSLEEFFVKLCRMKAPPSPEEADQVFAAHGMKIVGPPLSI